MQNFQNIPLKFNFLGESSGKVKFPRERLALSKICSQKLPRNRIFPANARAKRSCSSVFFIHLVVCTVPRGQQWGRLFSPVVRFRKYSEFLSPTTKPSDLIKLCYLFNATIAVVFLSAWRILRLGAFYRISCVYVLQRTINTGIDTTVIILRAIRYWGAN